MPIQLINGAHMYFERSGEGDEIIVFSHGLLFNHHMWDAQVAHFKNNFCCIAYDHRGQGQSDSIGNLDMDTLYEDAATLIEALCEPNRLKYLLLNQVFGWGGAKLVSDKVIRILFGKSSLEDPSKKSILEMWKRTIENHPRNITKAVAGVIYRKGIYEELSQINTKTLVAVGDEDVATTPAKAERIHQAISNSQFKRIARAGHSACIEQPESVNQLIGSFIR